MWSYAYEPFMLRMRKATNASSRETEMWRCVIVAVLSLQLAGTEDLYWQPNTDWSVASNWARGDVPCEGEVADLSDNPRGSVVVLGVNTTVRSLVLPVGGQIVLGKSITLRFSNKTSCTVESPSGPLVAEVKEENKFVGAGPKYWECPQNWVTQDNEPAKNAPCGEDKAFFGKDHYYYTVQSNVSIAVQSLSVRGQPVTSDLSAFAPEFNLDLKVVPECGQDPSRCPCPTNCKPVGPGKATGGVKSRDNSGRTAGIVVVVLVVVALVVLGIVLVLIYIMRQRRKKTTPYMKDDLLGEPEDSIHGTKGARGRDEVTFDNPIYDTEITGKEIKVKGPGDNGGGSSEEVKARELEAIAILRPTGEEYEPVKVTKDVPTKESPPKERSGGKKAPALNEYERL